MLFNSVDFIFVFFPLVILGYFLLGRCFGNKAAIFWALLASLLFYACWDSRYLPLLLGSMLVNHGMGKWLSFSPKKSILSLALCLNLSLLLYYKYANFFLDGLNLAFGSSHHIQSLILPLGISFFTFTQIAYLVDVFQGKAKSGALAEYCLFVTFFPHLIAGPILHHKDMMAQFESPELTVPQAANLHAGISLFVFGLAKKVLLADPISVLVAPTFNTAMPSFCDAWMASLAYTMQLYFDFSGYSDMAIGLALMMNLRFPLNFDSPYQSSNISEFWRRWHMSLSQYLRDYLYIPLGGNRLGKGRRTFNLMATMVLGGMWHGAGATFLVWGTLHGLFLCVQHAFSGALPKSQSTPFWLTRLGGLLLTFLVVVVGWVFFRAAHLSQALAVLGAMAGVQASAWGPVLLGPKESLESAAHLACLLLLVFALPNTQDVLGLRRQGKRSGWPCFERLTWRPTPFYAWLTAALAALSLTQLGQISEFLYFQF